MEKVILTGEHIILEFPDKIDIDILTNWENDPKNWLVSDTVAPFSREQIALFIAENKDIYEAGQLRFMIRTRNSRESAGCVDLYDFDPKNKRVGVGVLIDERFRGKGIAREALSLLISFCFDQLEVHCVYAEVLATNTSSKNLFESLSFLCTGTRIEWLWDGNGFQDQLFYQKLITYEA